MAGSDVKPLSKSGDIQLAKVAEKGSGEDCVMISYESLARLKAA